MDIQTKRDKAFCNLQTKINSETEEQINERIIAIDPKYTTSVIKTMSWEVKREVIMEFEYNYIQQCTESDLDDLYLNVSA